MPVEVISVGYTSEFFHPAVVHRLLRSGGGLRRADTLVHALHTIHHPGFIPWGLGASINLRGSSGVGIVSARGRGVALENDTVKIPCLEGVPTIALELTLPPGRCPRLTNTDDELIHIQLEV